MGKLAGKTAIVYAEWREGDSASAVAGLLAGEGAAVVLAHSSAGPGSANAVVRAITSAGGQAVAYPLDAVSPASWREATDCVMQEFGRLDIWVNVAESCGNGRLEEETVASWERTIREYGSVLSHGLQAVVPALRRQGGAIVHVASVEDALIPRSGNAMAAAAGAARIAARSAAVAHAVNGIRVNTVFVGAMRETDRPIVPLGRSATPNDVANAVLFLVSDEAAFVTGSELVVDGGLHAVAKRGVIPFVKTESIAEGRASGHGQA